MKILTNERHRTLTTPEESYNFVRRSIMENHAKQFEVNGKIANLAAEEESLQNEERIRNSVLRQLGLKWDPFIMPVSEQEFLFSSLPTTKSKIPDSAVLSYFIHPKNKKDPTQPILSAIGQAQPAFIYGQPGQGKTSLRLAFEAQCRRMQNPAMVILYEMGPDIDGVQKIEDHWQHLAGQLAIDLVIQVIERFQPEANQVTDEQIKVLGRQIGRGGWRLKRLVARIIEEPEPSETMGLGQRWPSVGRLAVRYVAKTQALVELLQAALANSKQTSPSSHYSWEQLQIGIDAARTWNFDRLFMLVDGVDNWRRNQEDMFRLIEPLLGHTKDLQEHNLYGKFFLPESLQSPIENFIDNNLNAYTLNLAWDDDSLKNLLQKRFRAAGSRRTGLNDLVADEFEESLDNLLIQEAKGSPRRLLKLVSALIDETAVIYSKQTPQEDKDLPKITIQMWHDVVQNTFTE